MDWGQIGSFLSEILPKLRTRIQLTGLVVAVAAALIVELITPGNTRAIWSAGGIGVSLLIFGQLFHFLKDFRPEDRPIVFLGAFLIFCVFTGAMVVLTAYLVQDFLAVSIRREADFRQSACLPKGDRNDLALFTDTYTFVGWRLPEYYVTTAEAFPGQSVRVFDLNSNAAEPLAPSSVDPADRNLVTYHWRTRVVKGQAKVKYEWRNAHPDDTEGLAFRSIYRIKDIEAEYQMPPAVNVRIIGYSGSGNTCFEDGPSRIRCPDLDTNDRVIVRWDWTMWKRCLA